MKDSILQNAACLDFVVNSVSKGVVLFGSERASSEQKVLADRLPEPFVFQII